MKYFNFLILLFILSACSGGGGGSTMSLQQRLENPLFAERYAEDMLSHYVDIQTKTDISEAQNKRIEAKKKEWKKVAKAASQKRYEGQYGPFNKLNSIHFAQGDVLIYDGVLYFGSAFDLRALDSVLMYGSPLKDPRDAPFPGSTDVLLGELQSPYGVQRYSLDVDTSELESVVLYQPSLKLVLSFASLR